jgi:CRP-like cAMP-binding protein
MPLTDPCTVCTINQHCLFFKSGLSSSNMLIDSLLTFNFKKGHALFMEGDKKKGIFFVKIGKIKCVKFDRNDREVIIKLATKGEMLGYSMVFTEVEHYEYCAVCMEDSKVCFLPYSMAKDEIQSNYELLKLIAQLQHKDMLSMVQVIMNGSIKNVRERIAYSIFMLKQTFGNDGEGYIDIAITREEIANMSATTTESSIRYMSEFQKDGIIHIKNRKIKITDIQKFAKIVGIGAI